jgi:hypothetical protein
MRHRPSVNDCSEESEYVESDVIDGVGLDTDLTDIHTCTDKDNKDDKDDKQCEGAEDEAWLSPDEDHPPEHYLQQLETFCHGTNPRHLLRSATIRYIAEICYDLLCCSNLP